ncbi:pyridoxamine 5'-phosphate oxidase family protein [Zeaxanthinibacter enoshimensis]|uniref:Pyridoxamine 5'-phosphate oxidase n=1 Tax=Zeaxanthinibacter enoshimensis TaxID=392009 RepID=A0A4R6TR36_9FLAO|nr:pyridoxamine 5'-phosphate oxidase family protein [Zeaxanthinibacter enoshimensis]TDQ30960.1 pyridoxamine 5'-phosphate oxidase [Zeaxanthinibacter enoshimensis]
MDHFKELKEELLAAPLNDGHPFRTGTFGTVGLDMMARLRTIVLRKTDPDLNMTFYTDFRSKKIIHIKENPKVSLLLYHPEKKLQLKVEGLAVIKKDTASLTELWQNMKDHNKRDYTTALAPGSEISGEDSVEYLDSENFLCMVILEPFKIEYLKLGSPHHTRIRFSKKKAGHWVSDFLVP